MAHHCAASALSPQAGAGQGRRKSVKKTPGQHFSGRPCYLLAAETEFGFVFFFQAFS